MNEDLLASAVSDWFKETDSPPPDPRASRAAAVARARRRGQVRRWWPFARAFGPPLPSGLSVTAAAMVLLVGVVLGLRLLAPEDPQRSTTAAPSVRHETSAAINWRTSVVDLRADSFGLDVEGQTFTTAGARIMVDSDPGDADYWTLELEWAEQSVGQRLNLYFAADDSHWWVSEIRTYDGRPRGEWVYAYGPFLQTPRGEAFEGDVRIDLVGEGRPEDPTDVVEATLQFEDLRLAVSPGAQGTSSPDNPVLAGLEFVRDILYPAPPPTPRPLQREEPSVEVEYGELTLGGEVLEDGVVRIFDDGAGNRFGRVVSVALGPDGTLWVARHKAIFALGRPGEVNIADGGPTRTIERIEANSDGSLTVHAGGVWRLDGGAWSRLEPAPPRTTYWAYGEQRVVVGLPDGSSWRLPEWPSVADGPSPPESPTPDLASLDLATADGWLSFTPDEIFPHASATYPGELQMPEAMLAGPSGDVWAYSQHGLSRFDDRAWAEVMLAELAGGPVFIREALVGEDGDLWVLVNGDDKGSNPAAIQRLLHLRDGEWDSIPLDDVLPRSVRRPSFYGLELLSDGEVQVLERDKEYLYVHNGIELTRVPELGPHDTVTAADGSVFGTARPRNLGLLMIPAGEIRVVEPFTGVPDEDPAAGD